MARATDLLQLSIPRSFAPWWVDIEQRGAGVHVEVDDPAHPEGSGRTLVRDLSAKELHAAFGAHVDDLCCGELMEVEGYGLGCSNDADLVLQYAVFGKVVYG